MLTGGLLVLAGCGGGTRVVTKTVTKAPTATVSKPAPATGPSAAALAAAAHAFAATAIGDDALQAASPVGDAAFMTAAITASRILSAATTSATATGHGGASKPRTSPQRVVSGQASGEYAVAYTNGTFHHPSQIVLNVAASPPQTGSVDWNVVCFELSGGIGRKEGRETLQLPTTKTLPLPAPSSTCIGSANVQLSRSGTVTISITG